jgi:transcription elongation GreA/GreB family factor
MISNESPVGKALLGKKVWDNVKVKAQSGTFEYKIIEIV